MTDSTPRHGELTTHTVPVGESESCRQENLVMEGALATAAPFIPFLCAQRRVRRRNHFGLQTLQPRRPWLRASRSDLK